MLIGTGVPDALLPPSTRAADPMIRSILATSSLASPARHRGRRSGLRAAVATAITAHAILLAACSAPALRATPDPRSDAFTAARFRTLGWLEGSWRGRLPDGAPFYERYRVQNDSTIRIHYFADSTFAAPRDSGDVALRGGIIRMGPGSVSRLDASAVEFTNQQNPSNRFTWTRTSRDSWTADLFWVDPQGQQRTVRYLMERVVPQR